MKNTTKRKLKNIAKSFVSLFKSKSVIVVNEKVSEDKILSGKVVLITGGNGGIGSAIAKKFIESGAKVVITGTNIDKLKKVSEELGKDCEYIKLDLYEVKSFKEKIIEAANKFGRLDILVNSAGIHIARSDLDFINITEEEYDKILDLNLKGTYFITQEFCKYLIKNKMPGNICFISSSAALQPAWSPYRISKWGIKGMTAGIAQKMIKYDIVVNGIGPGPTATTMLEYNKGDSIFTNDNPIKRYTMPEEIAELATMLVSSEGKTIVGDTIYMTGGKGMIED